MEVLSNRRLKPAGLVAVARFALAWNYLNSTAIVDYTVTRELSVAEIVFNAISRERRLSISLVFTNLLITLAASVGFEPTRLLHLTVFRTATINHSDNSPKARFSFCGMLAQGRNRDRKALIEQCASCDLTSPDNAIRRIAIYANTA